MAQTVKWLSFKDNSARLIIIVPPDRVPVIALKAAPGAAGEKVLEVVESLGFARKPGASVAYYPRGKSKITTKNLEAGFLAAGIEVETVVLNGEEFAQKPWRWTAETNRPTQPLVPDEPMEEIGTNFRGELVLRSSAGRFYRLVDQSGDRRFIAEAAGDRAALFLRAVTRQDIPLIAQGVMRTLEKVAITDQMLGHFRDLMLEQGPTGHLEIDAAEAGAILRQELVAQIGKAIRPEKDIRKTFETATRLSERSRAAGLFGLNADGFVPTPAIATALLRSLGSIEGLRHDIQGVAGLKSIISLSSRAAADANADVQLIDLTATEHGNLTELAFNSLARRAADGRSYFIVRGTPDDESIDRLREEVGRRYALETVATLSPQLYSVTPDAEPVTILGVGLQRREIAGMLPEAARRVVHVETNSELWSWTSEVLRSRGRIAEWEQENEARSAQEEAEAEHEANARQVPYRPLSQAKQPFTMIPMALEAATGKALRRVSADLDGEGGLDAVVARDLGIDTDKLSDVLTAEQVDLLGLQICAQRRGRGFLIADQTGVGKGRGMAAIARRHLRAGGRVIYFTESSRINIPDVWRDITAVGADREAAVYLLAADAELYNRQGELIAKAPSSAQRRELIESGDFPEDANLILTTYSQFSKPEGSSWHDWLRQVATEDTMFILDEGHNALSPDSNMGKGLRVGLENANPGNVIFGTATPLRDPRGADLYAPLLPAHVNKDDILGHLAAGREIAQETFTTMLAEDGVMIRRDHDLSNIDFEIRYPSNEQVALNRQYMDLLAPVVEAMLSASFTVSNLMANVQNDAVRRLLARGADYAVASSQVNQMHQYSLGFGSPLLNLTRVYMNALKVDQVVAEAINELAEGRKPVVTLHSTNAGVLQEALRNADGEPLSEAEIAALPPMSLRDQVRRVANSIFRIKRDGVAADAREQWEEVREKADEINFLIERLPDELPVSPIDALIERLEVEGYRVGELTGRGLMYREGRIVRRNDTDRRGTIDRFNNGEIDILVFNSAGATGGSYHASPDFADQRPRTVIEMETPPDIIKYIQAQGRTNRYGQVARPRVVSAVTGLAPEMRILAQRNRKLRLLGASVDANRSHPLLMDNVPDLINQVGDRAAERVLKADPGLARRMGFDDLVEAMDQEVQGDVDTTQAEVHSLANKVLSRSILLPPDVQQDLFDRVALEFDAIVEELDSQNANPLRPKMLKGELHFLATSLYAGQERLDTDLESSAFDKPLYISTGEHRFTEVALTGQVITDMIDRANAEIGPEGFRRWADQLEQSKPNYLQAFLPPGVTYAEASANPALQTAVFKQTERRLDRLSWLLENMRPGVQMTFPDEGKNRFERRTIVRLEGPSRQHLTMPSAYKIHLVAPGDSAPELMSLTRFLAMKDEDIRFLPGFSLGVDDQMLLEFEELSRVSRRLPVQVLSGNHLLAMAEARNHKLGAMSLYRTEAGIERGVVVNPDKTNLQALPCIVPNPETGVRFLLGPAPAGANIAMHFGMTKELHYLVAIQRHGHNTLRFKVKPFSVSGAEFWRDKPLLWRLATGTEMPRDPVKGVYKPITRDVVIHDDGAELLAALRQASIAFETAGANRAHINEISGAVLAQHQAEPADVTAPVIVEDAPAPSDEVIVQDRLPAPQPATAFDDADLDGDWAASF